MSATTNPHLNRAQRKTLARAADRERLPAVAEYARTGQRPLPEGRGTTEGGEEGRGAPAPEASPRTTNRGSEKRVNTRPLSVVPLDTGTLFAKDGEIRGVLFLLLAGEGAAHRVETTMVMLRLFVHYRSCFPSAKFAASYGMMSRRSFWRLVAALEAMGILTREPGWRENGRRSTNDYDLTKLVRLIARLIAASYVGAIAWVRGTLMVKVSGRYRPIAPMLDDLLDDPPQPAKPPHPGKAFLQYAPSGPLAAQYGLA